MSRVSKDEMFLRMAEQAALRATCLRAQVGCVVTTLDRTSIVSLGYNGNARGLKNACDSETPGECGCIHAEVNALIKAPYGQPLVLYTTTTPCLDCAKLILNSSVQQVFFRGWYRDKAGYLLLNEHLDKVEQLLTTDMV